MIRLARGKKILIGVALILIVGGLSSWWYLRAFGMQVRITQGEIQSSLEKKFPLTERYLLVVGLVLSHPQVQMRNGSDRIEFAVDADVDIVGIPRKLRGAGTASGAVRYDPAKGEFYLDHARIDSLSIAALPARYIDKVDALASLIARKYLERYPVYQLKESDFTQSLAKLVLKRVRVEHGCLVITLGFGGSG